MEINSTTIKLRLLEGWELRGYDCQGWLLIEPVQPKRESKSYKVDAALVTAMCEAGELDVAKVVDVVIAKLATGSSVADLHDVKKCLGCEEVKSVDDFYKTPHGRPQSYCKECNKARVLERRKRAPNARKKERENSRSPDNFHKKMYRGAKSRAKLGGLDFDLDLAWIREKLEAGFCPITGEPFVFDDARHPMTPSIDKIDSMGGYTKDNCRVVCYWFNTMKSDYTDAQVKSLVLSMVKNMGLS